MGLLSQHSDSLGNFEPVTATTGTRNNFLNFSILFSVFVVFFTVLLVTSCDFKNGENTYWVLNFFLFFYDEYVV